MICSYAFSFFGVGRPVSTAARSGVASVIVKPAKGALLFVKTQLALIYKSKAKARSLQV
jgi:hypothetical protein